MAITQFRTPAGGQYQGLVVWLDLGGQRTKFVLPYHPYPILALVHYGSGMRVGDLSGNGSLRDQAREALTRAIASYGVQHPACAQDDGSAARHQRLIWGGDGVANRRTSANPYKGWVRVRSPSSPAKAPSRTKANKFANVRRCSPGEHGGSSREPSSTPPATSNGSAEPVL